MTLTMKEMEKKREAREKKLEKYWMELQKFFSKHPNEWWTLSEIREETEYKVPCIMMEKILDEKVESPSHDVILREIFIDEFLAITESYYCYKP